MPKKRLPNPSLGLRASHVGKGTPVHGSLNGREFGCGVSPEELAGTFPCRVLGTGVSWASIL